MQEILLQPLTILDPRVLTVPPPMALAPRLTALPGTRLLLFDNGQLHQRYGHYGTIFQTVAQRLQAQYGI